MTSLVCSRLFFLSLSIYHVPMILTDCPLYANKGLKMWFFSLYCPFYDGKIVSKLLILAALLAGLHIFKKRPERKNPDRYVLFLIAFCLL